MIRRAALTLFILWPAAAWAQAENIAKGADVAAHAATDLIDRGGIFADIALLAAGAAIVVIGVLGFAVVSLYKRTQDVQDKRAVEGTEAARQVAQTAIAGTGAIADSSNRIAALETKVQGLSDRLSAVPADLARGLANQERISGLVSEILGRVTRGAT